MDRGYTLQWRKVWDNPVLKERGKRFSKLEAWFYMVNKLASGTDNPETGLKRGEFDASYRFLARAWRWDVAVTYRFMRVLRKEGMISSQQHPAQHLAQHGEQRFSICNYNGYNPQRNANNNTQRNTSRNKVKEGFKEGIKEEIKPLSATSADAAVTPKILFHIYRSNNQKLPGVKALTPERAERCQARINQAVRDGCLSQYLADFTEAVKKAQLTPFLRGEGDRHWRAHFDWFIENHTNAYAVLEGKYDFLCTPGGNGQQKQLSYADRVIAEAEADERRIADGKPGSCPVLQAPGRH
jgi:hypothetical protein